MPRVSLEGTDKSFEVKDGDVLYDALDDQGETLPHGCLSGSCGACKVEVLAGEEHLSPPSAIELNTIEALQVECRDRTHVDLSKIRLSCRARVKGDVRIKPFS